MYRIKEFLIRLGIVEQSVPIDHTCAICFESANEEEEDNAGDNSQILDCGHIFHKKCIERWIKRKNVCPICRRQAVSHADVVESSDTEESAPIVRRSLRGRPPLSTYVDRMADHGR